MRVLGEQDVASRRRRPRGRSRARRVPNTSGLLGRIRTVILLLLTLALGVSLIFLVPELEAEAERASESGVSGAVLEAGAPALSALKAGLVEFERTDDIEYIVAEGETLSEIAQRFGIDYETLAGFNDLPSPHAIAAGQVIVVPGTTNRSLGSEEQ